jgi:hypothetical protein
MQRRGWPTFGLLILLGAILPAARADAQQSILTPVAADTVAAGSSAPGQADQADTDQQIELASASLAAQRQAAVDAAEVDWIHCMLCSQYHGTSAMDIFAVRYQAEF